MTVFDVPTTVQEMELPALSLEMIVQVLNSAASIEHSPRAKPEESGGASPPCIVCDSAAHSPWSELPEVISTASETSSGIPVASDRKRPHGQNGNHDSLAADEAAFPKSPNSAEPNRPRGSASGYHSAIALDCPETCSGIPVESDRKRPHGQNGNHDSLAADGAAFPKSPNSAEPNRPRGSASGYHSAIALDCPEGSSGTPVASDRKRPRGLNGNHDSLAADGAAFPKSPYSAEPNRPRGSARGYHSAIALDCPETCSGIPVESDRKRPHGQNGNHDSLAADGAALPKSPNSAEPNRPRGSASGYQSAIAGVCPGFNHLEPNRPRGSSGAFASGSEGTPEGTGQGCQPISFEPNRPRGSSRLFSAAASTYQALLVSQFAEPSHTSPNSDRHGSNPGELTHPAKVLSQSKIPNAPEQKRANGGTGYPKAAPENPHRKLPHGSSRGNVVAPPRPKVVNTGRKHVNSKMASVKMSSAAEKEKCYRNQRNMLIAKLGEIIYNNSPKPAKHVILREAVNAIQQPCRFCGH